MGDIKGLLEKAVRHVTLDVVIRAIDKTKPVFEKLRSNLKKFDADMRKHAVPMEVLERAETGLRNLGGAFQAVGTQAALMGGAIVAPLGLSVKKFMDFEHAMKNVQAVSGASQEEFEQLSKFARQLGSTTAFSATEAAQAMYYLASAGWKTQDMMKGMPGLLDLAAATQSDLSQATDVVVSTLSQFGMSANKAGKVADIFAAAISNSQANMTKLQYSMRYVGPIAHSLGMSLEETTAALMALYNAGYQGEQAGTLLRNMLASLAAPSSKMLKFFSAHGIEIYKNSAEINALVQRLEALQQKYERLKNSGRASQGVLKALKNQIDQTKEALERTSAAGLKPFTQVLYELQKAGLDTAAITELFGKETGPGVSALLEIGVEKVKEFQRTLENSAGTAKRVAKEQLDSLWGSLRILKSAAEEAMLSFGEALAPTIKELARHLTQLVGWFNSLDPGVKKTIARIAAFVGVGLLAFGTTSLLIGGIMKATATWIEFGRTIMTVGPQLKTAMTAVRAMNSTLLKMAFGSVKTLGKSLWNTVLILTRGTKSLVFGAVKAIQLLGKSLILPMLTSPVFWIIAGVVAGVILLVKYWDKITAFIRAAGKWLLKFFKQTKVGRAIVAVFYNTWKAIGAVISWIWRKVLVPAGIVLSQLWGNALSNLSYLWSGISAVLRWLYETILVPIGRVIQAVMVPAVTVLKAIWEGIKTVGVGFWSVIKSVGGYIKDVLNVVILPFKLAWEGILAVVNAILEGIQKIGEFFDRFQDASKKGEEQARKSVEQMYGGYEEAAKIGAMRSGQAIPGSFAQGIRSGIPQVERATKDMTEAVDKYLPHSPAKVGPLSRLDTVGVGFINTIVEGMQRSKNRLIHATERMADAISKTLKTSLSKLKNDVDEALAGIRAEFQKYGEMSFQSNVEIFFKRVGLGKLWQLFSSLFDSFKAFLNTDFGHAVDNALGGSLSDLLSMIANFLGGPAASTFVGAVIASLNAVFDLLKRFPWFRKAWNEVAKEFRNVWNELQEVIRPLTDVLKEIMPKVAKMFMLVSKIGLLAIFRPLAKLLGIVLAVVAPIIEVLVDVLTPIVDALDTLINWLEQTYTTLWEFYRPIKMLIDGIAFLADILRKVFEWIMGALNSLNPANWFKTPFDWFKKLFGFAEGGLVTGPGGPTSDNLLARLSPGEFVVNARATQRWYPVLKAINEGKEPPTQQAGPVNLTINIYDATDPHRVKEVLIELLDEYALQRT